MKKLVLGALVAMAFIQPMNAQERQGNGHRQMDPQKMLEFRMQRLDKELDLSEKQENKIKAIYDEHFKQVPKERGSRKEMMKRNQELNQKIKEELTDEQKKKFDEMNKKMHRRGGKGQRNRHGPRN